MKFINKFIERPPRIFGGSAKKHVYIKHKNKNVKFKSYVKGNRNKIYQFIINNLTKKIRRKKAVVSQKKRESLHDLLKKNVFQVVSNNNEQLNQMINKQQDLERTITELKNKQPPTVSVINNEGQPAPANDQEALKMQKKAVRELGQQTELIQNLENEKENNELLINQHIQSHQRLVEHPTISREEMRLVQNIKETLEKAK